MTRARSGSSVAITLQRFIAMASPDVDSDKRLSDFLQNPSSNDRRTFVDDVFAEVMRIGMPSIDVFEDHASNNVVAN